VIRHIASAPDVVHLEAIARELFSGVQEVRRAGPSAKRDHRRMLEQQQRVWDVALEPRLL
jgi:hypothetical protein